MRFAISTAFTDPAEVIHLARAADAPRAGDGQEHLELTEGVAHIGYTE